MATPFVDEPESATEASCDDISAYQKLAGNKHIDVLGVPKHVFKVQEFTKLLLFGGTAALFIFLLGSFSKIASRDAKNKLLVTLLKECPECAAKIL